MSLFINTYKKKTIRKFRKYVPGFFMKAYLIKISNFVGILIFTLSCFNFIFLFFKNFSFKLVKLILLDLFRSN